MKKFKHWWTSHFQMGTNRFVILLSNKVIKIPKRPRGIVANFEEYSNSLKHPNLVANTKRIGIILISERLFNLETFTLNEINIPDYAIPLFEIKLNNRLQIGQNKEGLYKIFDYEDVKFYQKEVRF